MNQREIAQLIPATYRREILELNIVVQSRPIASDPNMNYLGIMWKEYISPGEDLTCGLCLQRILDNFRSLQAVFIELEKESKLLASV